MYRIKLSLLTLCGLLLMAGSASAQTGLKDIAADKKIYIGNLISIEHLANPTGFRGGLAEQNLTTEYDMIVLENSMKMGFVLPQSQPANIHSLTVDELQATLQTSQIERFLSRPEWQNMRKRGHAMIWYNQAPNWLNSNAPNWTAQQVFDFSRKYIFALSAVCGDRIDEWDVINEAISDQTQGGRRIWRAGTWYRKANDGSMTTYGEATYENYVRMLFVWAREAQPHARLYYNDYSIERFDASPASKNGFMRQTFKELKECGAPIDAIGFQSHFVLANVTNSNGTINQGFLNSVRSSIRDLAASGFEVAITELDIRICNNERPEAHQEAAYRDFAAMALAEPNVHELLIWGLRDEDHWITLANYVPFNGCQDAVIFEGDNYTKKAGYTGLEAALNGLPDRDAYAFQELVAGGSGPADCGGMAGTDEISGVRAPESVRQGETVTVSVDYAASSSRDIVIFFQLDSNPWTVYTEGRQAVGAGSGTVDIELTIPMNTPIAVDNYQFQTLIAPTGGSWNERLSNLERIDVDVTSGTDAAVDPAWSTLGAAVFPNPTAGQLTVTNLPNDTELRYALFDVSGKRMTGAVVRPAGGMTRLDLATLPAGFYTLTLEQNGRRSVQRVVKR